MKTRAITKNASKLRKDLHRFDSTRAANRNNANTFLENAEHFLTSQTINENALHCLTTHEEWITMEKCQGDPKM